VLSWNFLESVVYWTVKDPSEEDISCISPTFTAAEAAGRTKT